MSTAATAEILRPRDEDSEEGTPQQMSLAATALAISTRAELEQHVSLARQNPRSVKKFLANLESMACFNQEIATSMFYSLPRKVKGGGTKQILGPSARFAEIVTASWGNLRLGQRPSGIHDGQAHAVGFAFDCETLVGWTVEIGRRITDSYGREYSEDMITVTTNAAASIASRNAIFKTVPKALWQPVYEKAMKVAAGNVASLTQEINKAVDTFNKLGITAVQILNALSLSDFREATAEHLVTMRVLYKDVTGGEKTVEEVFGTSMDAEINMLMGTLGYTEAKKTLAWQEYKGRREDLLKFLQTESERDRKAGVKPTNGQPTSTATSAASVSEAAGQVAETAPQQEQAAGSGAPAAAKTNPSEALGALKDATSGNGTPKKSRFF